MEEVENVILLSVDALRLDHLSQSGYSRKTSPTLDKLASENVVFTEAISPSSHTREAVPSFLTGLYPDQAVDDSYNLSAPTIPYYLESSTACAGFHSNPFVSRAYGYGDDFDVYSDDVRISQNRFIVLLQRAIDKLRNNNYARASKINDRSLTWIDGTSEPFFLWNHYMDVHGPYEAPEEYQLQFRAEVVGSSRAQKLFQRAIRRPESITENERQTLLDLYDAEIRYLDDSLGEFVRGVRERGYDDTLIVITADHGEAFGEHGYYEHPRQLSNELLRVPLILVHPNLSSESVSTPVSTLDIASTVFDTLDQSGPECHGTSLWEILSNTDEYGDRTVFAQARGEGEEEDVVQFAAFNRLGRCELARDINTGEIVTGCNADAAQVLADALRNHSAERMSRLSATSSSTSGNEDEVNSAVESRLEALGYRE